MSARPDQHAPLAMLGGVFDPLHRGHVEIARAALQLPAVEEVVWIPCRILPHQKHDPIAPPEARLEMVRKLCSSIDGFVHDEIEFDRQGPSWTIDTIRSMSAAHPGRPLLWLIGADNIAHIGSWKDAEELWQLAIPVVAHRPDSTPLMERSHLPYLDDERWEQVISWQLPRISENISSTRIKAMLAAGEPIDEWVPGPVLEAIQAGGWYCSGSP
ncbi:MAG: nicotinate (nicotinamide) nucleotide adenylyltransferase [Bacillota bacterium]|nr:MAG: nicotinate (nicotinamide) nucleotide adenylyltransferase [Planctomycetota bacterium]RUA07659.1 MAG: nicotinate (nicotinamide) nucleotide adenylyltransferase [Bacillota bacterium]